jgi:hypothetical protein
MVVIGKNASSDLVQQPVSVRWINDSLSGNTISYLVIS